MIAIVDYDAGNTRSVFNAFEALGVVAEVTSDPVRLRSAAGVVLPGVGAAASAMRELEQRRLVPLLRSLESPLLGICLGLHLLFDSSTEGSTQCLGLVEGEVTSLPRSACIVPHTGWNVVRHDRRDRLFEGIDDGTYFYYVHSYAVPVCSDTIATTCHGTTFSAALRRGGVVGVQFHPEKSGRQGLRLLDNFVTFCTPR